MSSRKYAVISLFVAVSVLLSACIGVPLYGEVQTGPLIDEQGDSQYEIVAVGPVAGSSQEQILADFMSAVRSPSREYLVAREFLTSAMSATWNPAASTTVLERDNLPTIEAAPGTNSLTYSFSAKAVVDERGVYSELQSSVEQSLIFSFEKVAGEWRISQAPPGIVLSDRGFEVSFDEHILYYFDPTFSYLIPEVRWFAVRQSSQLRAIKALLAGDSAWVGQGALLTAFPPSVTLGPSTTLTPGRAVIDLSAEVLKSNTVERERMRQQLSATLGIPIVVLTVDGRDLESTSSEQASALIEPPILGPLVVGTEDKIGFDTSDGFSSLDELGAVIAGAGATAVVLSADRFSAVYRASGGAIYFVAAGAAPQFLDGRPNLVAPSLDPFDFVWSAQKSSSASLRTFDAKGTEYPLQSTLPADSQIVSLDVSRDGSRLLVYLSAPDGPQLLVYGIVRQQGNVPVQLVDPIVLPARSGTAIDATWVGSSTVAALSSAGGSVQVTSYRLGGPSQDLGEIDRAIQLVSVAASADGVRVLADGEVWRPQGSQAWVRVDLEASYMAVQQ